tara:strand:+ start:1503 stop:1823 length:321 start_codon:yes stop_codon:yes gene_type:complete
MAFYIKQNDTSPSMLANLTDGDGNAINLTGANVKVHVKDLVGNIKIDRTIDIPDPLIGRVRLNWQTGDTDTFGTYYVEFEATYNDGSIETFPNDGSVTLIVVRELN